MNGNALPPNEVYAKIAECIRFLAPPGAVGAKITFTIPGEGDGVIPIPLVQAVAPEKLKTTEAAILELLRKSKSPLSAKEIAGKLGYSAAKGNFGVTLRSMVSSGVLYKSAGLYTDDPSKFKTTDLQG